MTGEVDRGGGSVWRSSSSEQQHRADLTGWRPSCSAV